MNEKYKKGGIKAEREKKESDLKVLLYKKVAERKAGKTREEKSYAFLWRTWVLFSFWKIGMYTLG